MAYSNPKYICFSPTFSSFLHPCTLHVSCYVHMQACDLNSNNAGWIGAELNGVQGLIPETYVEVISTRNASKPTSPTSPTVKSPGASDKPQISPRQKPLLTSKSSLSTPESPIMADRGLKQSKIKARALYSWQPSNASKHLKMNKGDIINVVEQRENWWAGKIDKHVSKNLFNM